MNPDGYWQRFLQSRLSRRRAMAASAMAGVGAAALSLVGCGGGDSDSKSTKDASGLLNKPIDTTGSAARGGIFRDSTPTDTQYYSHDMNLNSVGVDGIAGWVYSRMVKYKTGTVDKLPDGSVEGDFCESFEVSGDGLQVTFKVRPTMKWDQRAPTNGRAADANDVVFSWNRWAKGNAKGSSLSVERNPDAPVVSVSAPDARTAVMKLAYPYAGLLPMLAFVFHPLMMPREADGGFDPRSTSRGSGAWLVEEHQPSSVIKLRRNPNWYEKDRPYYDGWDTAVVADYSQGVAQLRAGNLDVYYLLRQEDVVPTKRDVPSLVMLQRPSFFKSTVAWMYFGLQPGSPFLDERVRKAFSMEIDRDLILDTFSNKTQFASAGLPAETALSNFVGPGFPFWLEPRSKEMGEGAQSFEFNPAEAKKLMSAAGHPSVVAPWTVGNIGDTARVSEVIRGSVSTIGDFKLEPVNLIDYAREFIPKYQTARGDFKGVAYQGQLEWPDYDWAMYNVFYPTSPDFYMRDEDKRVTQFFWSQRRELDRNKRAEIFKDFQKYIATKMYYVPGIGDWKTFQLVQPWAANYGYHVPWLWPALGNAAPSQTAWTYLWYNQSKRS